MRVLSAVLLLTGCTSAPMTTIDELMRPYSGNVPGAGVVVTRDGATIFAKAYGLADVENRIPATTRTNYRLASVTKQFTATAILALVERGDIALDDPIGTFLPTLPPLVRPLRIRHLLTHTSGLVDYEDLIPESNSRQVHDRDVLSMLERENRLLFPAGSSYRYSNSGYALLALIVEQVSGVSFPDFLRREIFEPAGMSSSIAFVDGVNEPANRAFGHAWVDGRFVRADQSVTSAVLGDGGIYSSIDDLARWESALLSTRILSKNSLDRAWTKSTATDDPNVDYGFGWRISAVDGTTMLWHSGETRGFRNVMMRFPEKRLMVALLTNRNDPEPYELALKIARSYF
jgi:CubicO group peptidase (beta-lactamase class C family)